MLKPSRREDIFFVRFSVWHSLYMWCWFFAASLSQPAGNHVSYVLSPSAASRRFYIVVYVIYIFIVHVGGSEQVFYASSSKSSSPCEACTKVLWMTRNNATPLRPQCTLSASDVTYSKSDIGKKVISPERELRLRELRNELGYARSSCWHVRTTTVRLLRGHCLPHQLLCHIETLY